MKERRIRIDWDDLEAAFNNKNEELVYYLDTVTGHVHLEGEGEDAMDDEDDEAPRFSPTSAPDATRVAVPPPDEAAEADWMREFITSESLDGDVGPRLEQALAGDAPADAFREALQDDAETRDRWFLYRSERIHEVIRGWLDENQVRPLEPPPWGEPE